MLGNTMMAQSQQAQQMPTLSQSQAQLSSSLWSPGKETPRESLTAWALVGEIGLTRSILVLQIKNRFSSR